MKSIEIPYQTLTGLAELTELTELTQLTGTLLVSQLPGGCR